MMKTFLHRVVASSPSKVCVRVASTRLSFSLQVGFQPGGLRGRVGAIKKGVQEWSSNAGASAGFTYGTILAIPEISATFLIEQM